MAKPSGSGATHASQSPGTVIGEDVEVLSVSLHNGRQGLIATCQRAGRRHELALLDITIQADPTTSRLLAAYRRWVGDQG
jgi:hypothetical protein